MRTALINAIQSVLRAIFVEEDAVRDAFASNGHIFCPSAFTIVEDNTCEIIKVDFGYIGFNSDELSVWSVSELRAILKHELMHLAFSENVPQRRSRQRYFNRNLWAADMLAMQASMLG